MSFLQKCYFSLSAQCGIDLRKILGFLPGMVRYLRDLLRFRSVYNGRLELLPCLHDRNEEGGATKSEYFWQDLLVARMIFEAKPEKHVDIGSRVDGFVAHVAGFRALEVFDVRPISLKIPGVVFRQADLMKPLERLHNYCDSVSCLHTLEHFGLGRYGDPIIPEGFDRGFSNMAALLKKDGVFYLSVPVGIPRVEFNAHRIFDPRIIRDLGIKNSLGLSSFTAIWPGGTVKPLTISEAQFAELAEQRYALGVFTFIKRE